MRLAFGSSILLVVFAAFVPPMVGTAQIVSVPILSMPERIPISSHVPVGYSSWSLDERIDYIDHLESQFNQLETGALPGLEDAAKKPVIVLDGVSAKELGHAER